MNTILVTMIVIISPPLLANGPIQGSDACLPLVTKATHFQVKQELAKSMAAIQRRYQVHLGVSAKVAAVKEEIQNLSDKLQALEKDIGELLKDRDFTSGNPAKVLKATSRHKALIKKIDLNIQTAEALRQAQEAKLSELKSVIEQFERYILDTQPQDVETLGAIQERIEKDLNITEKEVLGLFSSSLTIFKELESLRGNLHNVQLEFDSLEIKASAVVSTMENGTRMLVSQFRIYGMTNFEIDDQHLTEFKTSDRSEFERAAMPGELVVIEGLMGGTLVTVSKDAANIRGKKYARIDRSLILNGIKHGDIYTDGTSTYGVVGFVEGRVMMQLLETKSKLPNSVLRTFRSVDIKTLAKSFRLAGYNSYNRPLLVGDWVFPVTPVNEGDREFPAAALNGKPIIIDSIQLLGAINQGGRFRREQWALLYWNSEDTGGIGPRTMFREDPVQPDFGRGNSVLIENTLKGRLSAEVRRLYALHPISEVMGILPNGVFVIRTESVDRDSVHTISKALKIGVRDTTPLNDHVEPLLRGHYSKEYQADWDRAKVEADKLAKYLKEGRDRLNSFGRYNVQSDLKKLEQDEQSVAYDLENRRKEVRNTWNARISREASEYLASSPEKRREIEARTGISWSGYFSSKNPEFRAWDDENLTEEQLILKLQNEVVDQDTLFARLKKNTAPKGVRLLDYEAISNVMQRNSEPIAEPLQLKLRSIRFTQSEQSDRFD